MVRLIKWTPRMRRAYAELTDLSRRLEWSRPRIEQHQLDRINALWGHAIGHVPAWRDRRRQHDLPAVFGSLDEYDELMPVLTKDDLRVGVDRFRSDAHRRGEWHRTSGSTGVPLRFFWTGEAHREVLRARYAFYAEWGIDIGDRSVFVWGGGERAGLRATLDRRLEHGRDLLRGRLRLSAFDIAEVDLDRTVSRIVRHRPAMIYGFTQAIFSLAQRTGRIHVPGLRAVVLTGEVVRPYVAEGIESAFGVPVVVEYGSTECHLIAGSARDGSLRVREDLVRLETEPRHGRGHDLLLTVLTNEAFPLFRYRIDDITDRPLEFPSEGFARMGSVEGRDDDVLITDRGSAVHPTMVDAIFESMVDDFRRYRVHQAIDGSVTVEVEPLRATRRSVEVLHRRLRKIVGSLPVRVAIVDTIRPSPSGKHRVLSSELARSQDD